MAWKYLRWLLVVALLLLVAGAIAVIAFVGAVQQSLVPPPDPVGQSSIATYAREEPVAAAQGAVPLLNDFSWSEIAGPPKSTRPWTRWWWPGGAVESATLSQQLQLLDDANFGGVEIQASSMGMAAVTTEAELSAVYSFDSPGFYHKLDGVMQEAEALGLQVDLTHLSGWPPGGPQINLEDSLTELVYGATDIQVAAGGERVSIRLPKPTPPANKYVLAAMEPFMGDFVNFAADNARFLSVMAARKAGRDHAFNPLNLNDTATLDARTALALTDKVTDGLLEWQAPEGAWAIIASYLLPSGEVPINGAHATKGFVVDHLRKAQVLGHYEYAFGERTGLQRHYGKGLRGIFNDSLEFRLSRMSVDDILAEFKARRGYDLEPLLPAVYVDGADDLYFGEAFGVHAAPEFRLTDHDDRIRYDYSRTLSDLMIERFIEVSAQWASARGLISRGQSYGIDLDLLHAMGANSIPETEQLQGGGSNSWLKMASSAAALYGRKLVSAESFVWRGYDYSSTALKLKAAADKLMLAGINHIIYHGTPYPWNGGASQPFGHEGWSPFSGVNNQGHFSSIVGPNNFALWPDIAPLNRYIARSQNLLRQGSSSVDVLIFYPFLGYRGSEEHTSELLLSGALPDYDARVLAADPLAQMREPIQKLLTTPAAGEDERARWLAQLQPLLQDLERKGISWGWVNAHAIDTGLVAGGRMQASGGYYGSLLLPNIKAIDPKTLANIRAMTAKGDAVYFYGATPVEQPGYDDAASGVVKVQQQVQQLLTEHAAVHIPDNVGALTAAIANHATAPVKQAEAKGIRSYARVLADGTWIVFFANQSAQAETLPLRLARDQPAWWFDAREGKAWPVQWESKQLEIDLGGYASRFLIIGRAMPDNLAPQLAGDALATQGEVLKTLDAWRLQVGQRNVALDQLKDWREIPELTYSNTAGVYRHDVSLKKRKPAVTYLLDLGLVYGSANVRVNGTDIGRASLPPFTVDISAALHAGDNVIKVEVQPALANGFIGEARAGNPKYAHMQRGDGSAFGAGLIGPVRLIETRTNNE